MLIDHVHQNNKLVLLALKHQQTRIFENGQKESNCTNFNFTVLIAIQLGKNNVRKITEFNMDPPYL